MDAGEAAAWLDGHGGQEPAGVAGMVPGLDQKQYVVAVDRVSRYIAAGDCYQANFTFAVDFEWFGSPLALYARLRERQPVRYGGFLATTGGGIVSLSPELFLEKTGDLLLTRPMKGTLARQEPAAILQESQKDKAENVMIVDLLRNDLGRIAANGSVQVGELFAIEEYPTVWQMVSEVSARIDADVRLCDVLRALFPCGSITGAPKIRALQILNELENRPRGLYTGAFGWIAPGGDFRLNVAIRTLELAPDHRGSLGIGSGIVADSVPLAEWAECGLKAGFLRDCDPGLALIETLRRENGIYPMWAGHLARLRRSAEWLGFPLDEQEVCRQLGMQPSSGTWRVRLTLDKAGRVEVASHPFAATLPKLQRASLAAARIDANDPLRRHKTTARRLYDEALGNLAADADIFDLVFLNQRGEVAEGARSNVFVQRDGILLTPPVDSGALPGVLRAELLASGKAREAVIGPEDLRDGFMLGNALRGLLPVRFEK